MSTPNATDIAVDDITEDQVSVEAFSNGTDYLISNRQTVIVPFYVTVPAESTIKMEVLCA